MIIYKVFRQVSEAGPLTWGRRRHYGARLTWEKAEQDVKEFRELFGGTDWMYEAFEVSHEEALQELVPADKEQLLARG